MLGRAEDGSADECNVAGDSSRIRLGILVWDDCLMAASNAPDEEGWGIT